MKLLSTIITDTQGRTKNITVPVDDQTAEVLEQCTEEIRRAYIIDEYEDQMLTRRETRRHISYEQITDAGLDLVSSEDSPTEWFIRSEESSRLHTALRRLTGKQYYALWRHAVDGITYEKIADELGIRWETVREYYHAAVKNVRKIF